MHVPSLRLTVLALALAAGLVLLVERLVVTDEEAIEALLERAAAAAEQGDFEALAATLHEDFRSEGRDREEAVAHVRSLCRTYGPRDITVRAREIRVEGDEATAQARLRVAVLGQVGLFSLDLRLLRTPDGWRVVSAVPGAWGP